MTTSALFPLFVEVTMHSSEAISSRVLAYIQALPSQTVSGTQLAQFIKFTFPGFSPFAFGTPKLRLFLERHVPGIAPVGKAGGDVLYGLRQQLGKKAEGVTPNTSLAPLTAFSYSEPSASNLHYQLWKAFSSPNSLWLILANAETGDVQAMAPGRGRLGAPWVHIPPCQAEVHVQIAKNFIATLSDEKQREALNGILSEPRWWDRMYALSFQMGLLRHWQFYRRREILRVFTETLAKAGIPVKPKSSVNVVPSDALQAQIPVKEAEQPKTVEDERLRRAVISVVEKMSISELRNLAVPVGNLLDEFRRGT